MPLVLADRVRETTTTTGTGTISLAGPVSGFQGFSTAIGNGNTTYYTIVDAATGAWEVGLGTYTSSGSTLARTTVLSSSNSDALVPFASGTKDVFVTQPAERAVYVLGAGTGLAAGAAAFTANGIPYASATNTLTTGSALTFDGTNLGVGGAAFSRFSTATSLIGNNGYANAFRMYDDSSASTSQSSNSYGFGFINNNALSYTAGGSGSHVWFTANTEQMRLTSTGLGIGTSSPATKLTLSGAHVSARGLLSIDSSSGNIAAQTFYINGSYKAALFADTSDNFVVGNLSSTGSLLFGTNGNTTRATLDSSGNLGLGVTPSAWTTTAGIEAFQVSSRAALWGDTTQTILSNNIYASSTGDRYIESGFSSLYTQISGQHRWLTAASGTAGNAITFTQAMTLDADGDLGIGASSPAARLHVYSSTSGSFTSPTAQVGTNTNAPNFTAQILAIYPNELDTDYLTVYNTGTGGNNNGANILIANAGRNGTSGTVKFVLGLDAPGGAAITAAIGTASNHPLTFGTNSAERMRLDASGNLGLGVTPSAWGGSYKGFQVNSTGALTSNGSNATGVGHNYYFDGTNNRYLTTGAANLYLMINNEHRWYNAASGLAGDPITFTQAMTLDASGNLLAGTTSTSPVDVSANGVKIGQGNINIQGFETVPVIVGRASTTGTLVDFYYRSTSTNNVGFITTNGTGVTYGTASDYRLKNITGPITNSGAYIDSLNPVEGTWKADGSTFVGLIAHEVQEASRTTVATGVKDGEQMQGMDYSSAEIIANLIAELQSLRRRVAQLEGNQP